MPSSSQARPALTSWTGGSSRRSDPRLPDSYRKLGMELSNGSRIEALPGTEKTIRGFSEVDLLIVEEAARVADELYYAARPFLAVSGGRPLVLSPPFRKRGGV